MPAFNKAIDDRYPKNLWHRIKKKPDVVIFDPPRSGLDNQTIDLLLSKKVKKIIYISCNPSTLAKNLKTLSKQYTLEELNTAIELQTSLTIVQIDKRYFSIYKAVEEVSFKDKQFRTDIGVKL